MTQAPPCTQAPWLAAGIRVEAGDVHSARAQDLASEESAGGCLRAAGCGGGSVWIGWFCFIYTWCIVNMVYIVYMVWYGDLGSAWVFRFAVPSTKDWKSCICFIKLLAISSIFFICEQIHWGVVWHWPIGDEAKKIGTNQRSTRKHGMFEQPTLDIYQRG